MKYLALCNIFEDHRKSGHLFLWLHFGIFSFLLFTYRNDPLENQVISEFRWVRIKRKSGSILLDNQHPWRRQQFGKFVKQQEHHQNDQDTKIA